MSANKDDFEEWFKPRAEEMKRNGLGLISINRIKRRQFEAWCALSDKINSSREALKAEQEGAWIACSERMPEEDGEYNVVWEGESSALWFSVVLQCWVIFDRFGDSYVNDEVTHWQPLPAPPYQSHPIDTASQQFESLAKGGRDE